MTTLFQLWFTKHLINKAILHGKASRELDAAIGIGIIYAILLDIGGIVATIKLIFF